MRDVAGLGSTVAGRTTDLIRQLVAGSAGGRAYCFLPQLQASTGWRLERSGWLRIRSRRLTCSLGDPERSQESRRHPLREAGRSRSCIAVAHPWFNLEGSLPASERIAV